MSLLLLIYLIGVIVSFNFCLFAMCDIQDEVNLRDVIAGFAISLFSWLSLLAFIAHYVHLSDRFDKVVFNKKGKP